MNNNRFNALLARDTATVAGLLADQPNYQPLEADIAPLRAEHAANLARARTLEAAVLAETQDDATRQKAGAKTQLKALGARLAAALQAHAASAANPDPDLAGRVGFNRTSFNEAGDASFASIVTVLLKEALPLASELEKRAFMPADRALTETLLLRFEAKQARQRMSDVTGGTARKTLGALLGRNADLIKQLRVQLKPYQDAPAKHEVWLRFQGYTRVIIRGGGGQPSAGPGGPPQA